MVVRCDKERLYQVLENLVSNALKFSPPETRVVVRQRVGTDSVRIEVQDAGPGVDPTERSRLFQEFTRLSNRPTGTESSTGLGLYIARRLIEAQHGRLGAEFPPEGGSIFWLELPRTVLGPSGAVDTGDRS